MIRTSKSNSSYQSNKTAKLGSGEKQVGTVVFVYLDDTEAETLTLPSDISDKVSDKELLVGHAKIALKRDATYNVENIPSYPPYNPDEGVPLIGETVEMITVGGKLYYKRIPNMNINQGNAREDAQLIGYPDEDTGDTTSDYSTTSQTGTTNSQGEDERSTKLGEYFEPTQINPLRLYEGDKLIQSRFGQSLRFSGYNNVDNTYAPTIILRNRQSDKSVSDLKEFEITEEDIVNDGSTIVLASGDYEIPFVPGNDEVQLETDDNLVYYEPPELKGTDQILMNSGRIVLSSKDSEMIFFSKGNYSFISDGKLTIDNGFDGAQMDFNGEVRITTNQNPVYILGDGTDGKIFLNTEEETEPIVRGDTLQGLLEELIDLINKQVFSTPSGPTKIGPNNSADFSSLRSRLETLKSTTNFTE